LETQDVCCKRKTGEPGEKGAKSTHILYPTKIEPDSLSRQPKVEVLQAFSTSKKKTAKMTHRVTLPANELGFPCLEIAREGFPWE